ncbi:MAG: hypothetical protein FWF52_11410 [Candidatus Azobacteroides sp.]|nr:hypothetical protein [Candidatus Azobacteroides sp.]
MFKRLFVLLYRLIAETASSWEFLSEDQEKDNENFYKDYLFPIIGLIALLAFVGVVISTKAFSTALALKVVIRQVVIYLGSFYLVSFIVSEWLFPFFGMEKNRVLGERFTGYSSALIYIVAMIEAVFPSFFFLEIIVFYTIYMIWTSAGRFFKMEEELWMKFTIFASVLIMLAPYFIKLLINIFMPNMKI